MIPLPNKTLLANLIAHRGGGTLAPENTMTGFDKAYQLGFKSVEFDVKLSADNQCIVFHDEDLKRLTGRSERIQDLTFNELINTNVTSNSAEYPYAPIPSFKEVTDFCIQHQLKTNVEIKPCPRREIETAKKVCAEILEYWHNQTIQPVISSFSIPSLEIAQHYCPNIPRALLIEKWTQNDQSLIQQLRQLDCVGLHIDGSNLSESLAKTILEAGFYLACWTINDLNKIKQLFSWGVQSVFTDDLALISQHFSLNP